MMANVAGPDAVFSGGSPVVGSMTVPVPDVADGVPVVCPGWNGSSMTVPGRTDGDACAKRQSAVQVEPGWPFWEPSSQSSSGVSTTPSPQRPSEQSGRHSTFGCQRFLEPLSHSSPASIRPFPQALKTTIVADDVDDSVSSPVPDDTDDITTEKGTDDLPVTGTLEDCPIQRRHGVTVSVTHTAFCVAQKSLPPSAHSFPVHMPVRNGWELRDDRLLLFSRYLQEGEQAKRLP